MKGDAPAMSRETYIDATNDPSLARAAKEVRDTGTRRVIRVGQEDVALLTPLEVTSVAASQRLRELAHQLAGSLAEIDIPGWETSEEAERWVEELRNSDCFPFEPPRQG